MSSTCSASAPLPASLFRPLFPMGRLLATPGAIRTLELYRVSALALLSRHVRGDWGEICTEDRQSNAVALDHGLRLMSVYTLSREEGGETVHATVWVITEADRASTTVLLPEEY